MTESVQRVSNPYDAGKNNSQAMMHPGIPSDNAMVAVSTTAEVARVQAQMFMAKQFPRDERLANDRILNAFQRSSLASTAMYQYARGGSDISGLSIRAAEALAQYWGNIDFGFKEVEQKGDESTVEAYCWDLETNTRRAVVFRVSHYRDTKKGRVKLEDARDKYELVANQASRRVRACILALIPSDVQESAKQQIELTMQTNFAITPEYLKEMLASFDVFGVTKEQIESLLQRRIDTIQPAQAVRLSNIYNSLADGMSNPSDWFEMPAAKEGANGGKATLESMAANKAEKPQEVAKTTQSASPAPKPAKPQTKPAGANDALEKALAASGAPVTVAEVQQWCQATGQLYAPDIMAQDLRGTVNAVLDWRDSK